MKEDFSVFDENDDASSLHTMRKPKTMDNNCVNLQCLNNRQKLIFYFIDIFLFNKNRISITNRTKKKI